MLFSGLNLSQFGHTNLVSQMEENGYIVHLGKEDATFSEYNFKSTFSDENENVFFLGKDFQGKVLAENLDNPKTVYFALKALSVIIEKNLELASVGAGGILVQETDEVSAKVLFLPGNLFERSAINLEEEDYCLNQGFYFYKGLESKDALIFLRSAIAYRNLCGNFPFTETDLIKRQADIFDHNFLPVKLAVFGIDEKLADSIDSGLKIFSEDECFEENSRFVDEKKKQILDEIVKSAENFDSDKFLEEKNKAENKGKVDSTEAENFKKLQDDFSKKQKRKIFFNRIVRRNKNFIRAGIIALLALCYGSYSFHKTNQNLATSLGLDSTQTTQAMYSFISKADVPDLQEIVKGDKMQDLIVKVAGFHVRAKERIGFTENGKIVSVEERLNYKPDSQIWMFGITNLKIDGKDFSILEEYPRRKDKNSSIGIENSVELKKNDEKTHTAEYFLVMNDENFINVQKISDTVTLRWDGKRWRATEISGKVKDSRIKMKDFWNDFKIQMQENNGDIKKSTGNLQEKYPWLPK